MAEKSAENSPTSYWLNFFLTAGVPSKISRQYAKLFVDHRIQKWQLADLNKNLLNEIGVTAIGDSLAILRFAKQELERTSYEHLGLANDEKLPVTLKSNLKRTSEGIFAKSAKMEKMQIERKTAENVSDFEIPAKRCKNVENSNFSRTVRVFTEKKASILDRLGGVTVTLQKSGGRVKFAPETKEEEVTSTTAGFTALESDKILSHLPKESMNDRLGSKKRTATIVVGGSSRVVLSAFSQKRTAAKSDSAAIRSRLGPKIASSQQILNVAGSGVFGRLGKKF